MDRLSFSILNLAFFSILEGPTTHSLNGLMPRDSPITQITSNAYFSYPSKKCISKASLKQ